MRRSYTRCIISSLFLGFFSSLIAAESTGAVAVPGAPAINVFNAKINFQPASASIPAGYRADTGLVYGSRGGGLAFGWDKDNQANTRNRNNSLSPDQRYDTFAFMQRENQNFTWELAVPNGSYEVKIVAGDPTAFDSIYGIDVEGIPMIMGTPTTAKRWLETTTLTKVNDGRLTVRNRPEAKNNKICFIEVKGFEPLSLSPKAQIAEPSDRSVFLAGTDVQVRIEASDPDGYVSRVELFAGTNRVAFEQRDYLVKPPPGELAAFHLLWKNVPAGNYALVAKAIDDKGLIGSSSPVNIQAIPGEGASIVTILTSDPEASESNPLDVGVFKVIRTGKVTTKLNVRYSVSGNASNGIDYDKLPGLVTIPMGESSAALIVKAVPDKAIEGKESVIVSLDQPALIPKPSVEEDYLVGSPKSAAVTIYEDVITPTRFVVERRLPSNYTPGVPVTVELVATPPASAKAFAIEDKAPTGWSVVANISHDGTYDPVTRQVKFGPFFDSTPRTLRYSVTPPAGESGEKVFTGTASADGVNTAITGASRISSAVLHPADNNPANNAITLSELTAYGAAWRTGKAWPINPNPIPVSYVTRAGWLWKGGETYRYDPSAGPAPLWWVNSNAAANFGVLGIRPASRSMAMREIQSNAAADLPLKVTIYVSPGPGVSSQAIEERLPQTATLSSVSDEGAFEPVTRILRWGPFLDNRPRVLSYQISAPGQPLSPATLSGVVSFDGKDAEISGQWEATPRNSLREAIVQSVKRLPSGVELICQGEVGSTYSLEATHNFTEWIELHRVTATETTFAFVDRDGASMGLRFYRVSRVFANNPENSN
jgi:hypothetical protein